MAKKIRFSLRLFVLEEVYCKEICLYDGVLAMSVSLKGFFARIPCSVPTDLRERTRTALFTPQEAVGFLRGAKDRLVRQVLAHTTYTMERLPSYGSCYIRDSSGKEVKMPMAVIISQQVQKQAEETIGKITSIIEQKIAEISRTSTQSPKEQCASSWLLYQFFITIQRVGANPEMVSLLRKHDIIIPQLFTEATAIALLDQLQDLFSQNVPPIFEVKKSIKSWFFSIVGQNLPESMLQAIQLLPIVPELQRTMRQAGLTFPPFITRENVAQWLLQVDDRFDQRDAAAEELESVLKPRLDELLEKSLKT
jgi:hypothetical protein